MTSIDSIKQHNLDHHGNINHIDADEYQKFEKLAYEWWDVEGSFKALHAINPLRLRYIHSYAELKGKKILDVGCGGGILCEAMARLEGIVTGIDWVEKSIKIAKIHSVVSQLNIDYHSADLETFQVEQGEQFDVITCMEMLEHISEPQKIISACARLLKPGGYLFLSTLNRNLKSFLQAIIAAEYFLKLLPVGTHSFEKFIKPSELSAMLRQVGLELKGIKGLSYHLMNKQYFLTDDIGVNYLMCVYKPITLL